MSNAPDLKPCPFCGGKTVQDDFSLNAFICDNCGAVGPEGHRGEYEGERKAEYAERWNTRDAITPAMAAEALLNNRWAGYGNNNALQAVFDFIHQETGRSPFPASFYDGVLQAAFRAIAAQEDNA